MTAPLDARGLRCPWPALRLARAMRESAEVVIADDPAAPAEIAALAAAHGWTVAAENAQSWRVRRPVNEIAAQGTP